MAVAVAVVVAVALALALALAVAVAVEQRRAYPLAPLSSGCPPEPLAQYHP